MPYDFSFPKITGPTQLVRGHSIYMKMHVYLIEGPGTTTTYNVTGLPSGVTAGFPDFERFCCPPDYQLSPESSGLRLTASGSATLGAATVTVHAVSTVTRTCDWDITVVDVPADLPSDPPDYTPITGISTWESRMLSYGATHCATLQGGDIDNLDDTYYDAERVYYNIALYTGDLDWYDCAGYAEAIYRDLYVIPNGGSVTGYNNFTGGLRMDFELTADATSSDTIFDMSTIPPYSQTAPVTSVYSVPTMREVSYAIQAYINAEALGYGRNDQLELYVDCLLGHLDMLFISKNFRCAESPDADDCDAAPPGYFYTQPFMVGLAAEALILYYEEIDQDPRIPAIIKTSADWIWEHAWYASTKRFWYDNSIADSASIPSGYWASASDPPTGSVDLNNLIAPVFAWLFRMTGDPDYRDHGDDIFSQGSADAFMEGSKQYNQNYRWSFAYVDWRTSPDMGFLLITRPA